MIHVDYCNSKDKTAVTLAAQHAADVTYRRDFADGKRKFWQGYSLCYCCNGGERAGYWAAASEDALDALEQRIAREEYDANREALMGAW